MCLTFIHFDRGGDIDFFLIGNANKPFAVSRNLVGANVMWRNNGNGTFTDVTESLGLQGRPPNLSAIGTDYNNDRAVDITTTGMGDGSGNAKPEGYTGTLIYENPREGRFVRRAFWSSSLPIWPAALASGTSFRFPETAGVTPLVLYRTGWY